MPNVSNNNNGCSKENLKKVKIFDSLMNWDLCLDDDNLNPETIKIFTERIFFRLSIQWTQFDFLYLKVKKWIDETLEELTKNYNWNNGKFKDKNLFFVLFLHKVCKEFPDINPYYYDIPIDLIQKYFPNKSRPVGPHSNLIIEEAPFIVPSPVKKLNDEELNTKSLLMKSPSDSYRLDFLKSFFKNADFKILYLTRNPAASINGIMDGWLHYGFYSHLISNKIVPEKNRQNYWWCFDLPPNWDGFIHKALIDICAFQWKSANDRILEFIKTSKCIYLQIYFEELISSYEKRKVLFKNICDFLSLKFKKEIDKYIVNLSEPIMATEIPKTMRWKKRHDIILEKINEDGIKDTMKNLGYNFDIDNMI